MRSVRLLVAGTALALGQLACSSSTSPARDASAEARTTSFAVLPPQWVNEEPRVKLDAGTALASELARARGIRVIEQQRTRAAMAHQPGTCADDAACARGVGRRLSADKVVTLKLAELGDTVLVRMTVLDVKSGTQEQAHQRVVQGARATAVGSALGDLAREAARPFAPPEPRKQPKWYERWYTWAGAAAVAVGAGVALVVAGSGDEPSAERKPDVTVKAP